MQENAEWGLLEGSQEVKYDLWDTNAAIGFAGLIKIK